jgi:hypothetical protein
MFELLLQPFWAKKNLVKSLLISTLDKVIGLLPQFVERRFVERQFVEALFIELLKAGSLSKDTSSNARFIELQFVERPVHQTSRGPNITRGNNSVLSSPTVRTRVVNIQFDEKKV